MKRRATWILPLYACLLAPTVVVGQVAAGQTDTFESGTTDGWFSGIGFGPPHPAPPVNVPTGGPAGAGDHFLLVTATGGPGPGSRLTAMNASQWAGNYLAAGITGIGMSVKNFSATDLFLRLVFEDPTVGPPSNVAFSGDPFFLPGGSDWTDVFFSIMTGALVSPLGTVDAALANTTVLRIYHSETPNFPNPVFPIETVSAQLGVDNITASTVPEPMSLALLATGLAGIGAMARRGRRKETGTA